MYLKSFGRVRVIYPDPEQCSIAWRNLVGHEFQGGTLQLRPVTVSHTTHSPTHTHTHSDTQTQTQTQTNTHTQAFMIGPQQLQPPEKTKMFLISPPASPPVGWEQSREAAPVRNDFHLVSALASLQLPGLTMDCTRGNTVQNTNTCLPLLLRSSPSLQRCCWKMVLLSLHPNIIVHVENVVSLFSSPSTSSQKVRKCGSHTFLSQAM